MSNRIVFTLTTLPSRLGYLEPTLKSLNCQTVKPDAIYLTVPTHSKRLGEEYKIPSYVYKLCTVVPVEEDYGPITKIVGALIKEHNPDTFIITVDDDIIYPDTLIESFLEYAYLYENSALGSAGLSLGNLLFRYSIKFNQKKNDYWFTMTVPSRGKPVDILYGYSGVLYRRWFFPTFNKFKSELLDKLQDPDMFRNDDVTLSFYLNNQNIERRIIPMSDVINKSGNDGLSDGTISFFRSLQRAVKKCQQMGWGKKYESINICETFTLLGVFILVTSILLILFVYWSYRKYVRNK
jgi:hypothetical protein